MTGLEQTYPAAVTVTASSVRLRGRAGAFHRTGDPETELTRRADNGRVLFDKSGAFDQARQRQGA